MKYKLVSKILAALFLSLTIIACGGSGGGGGNGSSSPNPVNVEGVAATGSPIQGNVYLKDSSGTELVPVPIGQNGSFLFDVTGLTPPFYLHAEELDANGQRTGRDLYSVSTGSGTANINPLTNLAVAAAAGISDPSKVYKDPGSYPITQAGLDKAVHDIQVLLASVLSNPLYNASLNFLTGPFEANHQGLDKVLDDLKIAIDIVTGKVTFSLRGMLLGSASLYSLYFPDDDITSSEVEVALAGVNAVVSGNGINEPFRGSLTVNNVNPGDLTGSLNYSYQGMFLYGTPVTAVTLSGNVITIAGAANVIPADRTSPITGTFVVTIVDGTPDQFGVEIKRANGTVYFSTDIKGLVAGDFTVNSEISGNGLNEPFRASLSVNNINSTSLTGSLNYSFQGMMLSSTSITDVTVNGDQVTVAGEASVIPADRTAPITGTFVATIINGNGAPDQIGIKIYRLDGSLYYSADIKELVEGDFVIN